MGSALVGFTGFVGGNLSAQHPFDEHYRSTNIHQIAGRSFDLVVCAGAPAAKYVANSQPDQDRKNLELLQRSLAECRASEFILISTVDVYAQPLGVDEDTPIDVNHLQPYGRHRRLLELFVAERFPRSIVLRLPGLFGPGLRKNFLFDLLHGGQSSWTHCQSVFQFYSIGRLWEDCRRALSSGQRWINLATEPVQAAEVARRCFDLDFVNQTEASPVRYDMQTLYASALGGTGHYLCSAAETFAALSLWIAEERRA
jgi:nucleoside-diphosphate-sugar epimerase